MDERLNDEVQVIAIVITAVILQITWQSWRTVHGHQHSYEV